jgi:hypothetical protein
VDEEHPDVERSEQKTPLRIGDASNDSAGADYTMKLEKFGVMRECAVSLSRSAVIHDG